MFHSGGISIPGPFWAHETFPGVAALHLWISINTRGQSSVMNSLTGGEIGLARRESNREPTPDRFRSDQAMESQVVTPHTYCFEEFSLDVRTGELSSGEKKILLREQSLQLLLALLERPRELVTRAALLGR